MVASRTILFVAVHLGPYKTIRSLAEEWSAHQAHFLLDGPAQAAHCAAGMTSWNWPGVRDSDASFEQLVLDRNVRAVIVGTSEGLPDGNIELFVLEAANRMGLPVFAVEDFPGNYRHRPGAKLEGLFVEDPSLIDVHVKWGIEPERIHCVANPRYDALRVLNRKALRRMLRTRLNAGTRSVILWAGQPDEASSYEAFERLLPGLLDSGATLWFKAHPRDQRYRQGAYRQWLDHEAAIVDVTAEKETTGLCCAADLVVTQFSSVGVEAGHLDTPALYALFDDLGMAYLRRHKGYSIVPWAANGSAFLLRTGDHVDETIGQALHDEAAREAVKRNFHERHGARPPGAAAIAAHIQARVGEAHNEGSHEWPARAAKN